MTEPAPPPARVDGPEAAPGAAPAAEPVIEARGLAKVYGGRPAVDGLDLVVPRGSVFGLLGRNGAGKTTTMRMLLGLIRPTRGSIRLFGRALERERLALLPRIGCLVEGPAFYPYLTGRQNLALLGGLIRPVSPEHVQAALERVGLGDRGDDRFGAYSTGMRQRLGIAAALVHDPELVVLDEPVNGLDPPAVLLVRRLIRRLVEEEGRTVLVSSHLLHEVELTCDRLAIIERGRVVAAGETRALVRPDEERVEVTASDAGRALALCRGLPFVRDARPASAPEGGPGAGAVLVALDGPRAGDLNRALVEAGLEVSALVPRRRTLEELFHALARDADEAAGDPAAPPGPGGEAAA